ncbi:sugar-phosphatase [Clostridium weizhouense]|uniref:Sugar-phosphatase n=1 Tax=Clostridium weizhouense TaxID=2859781 RepID=A0ABS7AKW4_9CLOT|nr:sugar-phosphatase [Clostridium weizhouense]MBW6409204.1 sugar-phosphatase [Clostridium weizhouense]
MYKLIALDMDGTLLTSDKKISERNKKAIKKAEEKGVKVVLASGRPSEGLRHYLEELNLLKEEDYVLSFNGAVSQNAKTGEIMSSTVLNGSDLKYLNNIAKETGVNIHAFSEERGLITPKISKYTEVEADINKINITIADFDSIDDDENIVKVMMIDPEEVLEETIKKLPKEVYEKYTVLRSTPYFLEFMNKEVDKGEGLKKLAESLGIKREEVIAMGDAGNDLSMVKYAGLGVAMDNGFPEVKEVAEFITKSNDEDGVAYAIEKFVL